ncbi:hypothetical protein Enr13x_10730 [Stieleria neptunia]|uniref:Uncharacterized protein n=1 Tax=Stieleria neptunia TaxID=2527979 RepID=A0A518HK51_9BACT|nr:hypothetical protein [Stieleria neptunia]QDV41235.1 hypothetical protein Enr13x_10730 [Stieleria neptunia]
MEISKPFQTSSKWIGGGLIAATLAVFGLLAVPGVTSPNQKAAPYVSDSTYPIVRGAVSLASSMWDDPFVHHESDRVTELAEDSDSVKELVASKLGSSGKIMFLVVPVDEGFESEKVESRRRRRHAVELAMANQGFSLSFPDRMTYRKATYTHYFSDRSPNDVVAGATSNDVQVKSVCDLPTKLYRHRGPDGDLILVTWIQNSHLGKRPLDTIRQVIEPIVAERLCKRASFCLLGPPSSDTLREIVADAGKIRSQVDERRRREELNSSVGTKTDAPPGSVDPRGSVEDSEALNTQEFFKQFKRGSVICNIVCTARNSSIGIRAGQDWIELGDDVAIKIFHTIGSDDRLLSALRRELDLRGVLPGPESLSQMILFVEQSSLSYINDLQASFKETAGNIPPVVIPYLKGIASDLAESASETSGSLKGTSSVRDYLDRSMTELTTISSSRGINPSRVRSVGIIGSNWEDKNLILKEAHEVFPVATFFTTELDARYNVPQTVPHARNLIVASHYGLAVHGREDIFGRVNNIPSFRDGYQTSGFIGTSILCYAFRNDKLKDETLTLTFGPQSQDLFDLVGRGTTSTAESPAYLAPLTFEIGSRSPVQFGSTPSASYLPLRQPPPVNSILDDWRWLWMILISSIGGLLFVNFLARFSTDLTRFQAIVVNTAKATTGFLQRFASGGSVVRESPAIWPIVFGALLIVLVILVMLVSDATIQSEPILFFNGVSLWPPIWGLTFVVILSLNGIARAHQNIPDNIHEFAAETNLQQPDLPAAFKLAATTAIVFYLVSYIESGVIQPPARDWLVRWLAIGTLLAATLGLLTITFNSLLFCLYARKIITNAIERLPQEMSSSAQVQLVNGARCTMHLSIVSSRKLVLPAILSILLIAARWRIWDAWGLDTSWYILLAIPIFISFLAAIVVRFSAIRYRDEVVENIRQAHYAFVCEQKSTSFSGASLQDQIDMLDESEEEITRLHSGPFGPISQDYLLGAGALVVTIAVTGPASLFFNRLLTIVP